MNCEDALVTVPADSEGNVLFFAMAAFPSSANPDLAGVTFGILYDADRILVTATGHCGTDELNTPDWPLPGSGTAVVWNPPLPDYLVEMRWFAGYAISGDVPSTFELTVHPTQGGNFVGGGVTQPIDTIADYGRLGFGMDGYLPCPDGPVPSLEKSWGSLKSIFR
jgi:hypothetical protein